MTELACPSTSQDRRLLDRCGRRFLWLGDTAWELIHRLTLDGVRRYADARRDQGFTVVQCCVIAELDGLREPDPDGELPLIDLDPTRPNPRYLRRVRSIVETLNGHGLVACVLPTWGDKVHRRWGSGPEVFKPENAEPYANAVAEALHGLAVVWMLGGDRDAPQPEHRETWAAMARGLRAADERAGDRRLITYHPQGGQGSSACVGDPDWIDFHCVQSGHTVERAPVDGEPADTGVAAVVRAEIARHAKPVIDAEPLYENHPRFKPGWQDHHGYSTAEDVLHAMRSAIRAGAAGVTYGCHDVWQMYDPAAGRKPVNGAKLSWQEALRLPAAERVRELAPLLIGRA